jgi:hypothetical protein
MENPGSLGPSPEPSPESENGSAPAGAGDFLQQIQQARKSGDYDLVLTTAKQSYQMLVNFKNAIEDATFEGRHAAVIAMGLNFLTNMVQQASQQIKMLKQTAKATQDAIKAAQDATETPPVPPEAA